MAGIVAACASYSYNRLNALSNAVDGFGSDDSGGSVTFVHGFTGNTTLTGMTGWTLLLDYIGSMALYAFAFTEFTIAFP